MDDAVFVDRKITLHRQTIIILRYEVFKVFAVLDGTAHMWQEAVQSVYATYDADDQEMIKKLGSGSY